MVLYDVAYDAEAIEVAAAPSGAEVLLEGELHRLDVLRVPRWLEDLVGPTEGGDVEDDLRISKSVSCRRKSRRCLRMTCRRGGAGRVEGLRLYSWYRLS